MALATVQKGSSTIAEFFSRMKPFADDMADVQERSWRMRRSPPTSSPTST
jgi:hypothetical protein